MYTPDEIAHWTLAERRAYYGAPGSRPDVWQKTETWEHEQQSTISRPLEDYVFGKNKACAERLEISGSTKAAICVGVSSLQGALNDDIPLREIHRRRGAVVRNSPYGRYLEEHNHEHF